MGYLLITGAITAAAYKVKNKLADRQVLLGEYLDIPAPLLNANKIIGLPNPGHDAYIHLMLNLCLDRQIETIYPLRLEEQFALKQAITLFSEFNIAIVIPK